MFRVPLNNCLEVVASAEGETGKMVQAGLGFSLVFRGSYRVSTGFHKGYTRLTEPKFQEQKKYICTHPYGFKGSGRLRVWGCSFEGFCERYR